ncbi:MAG: replication initiation protein [Bacteroidales bacterium]|jgi:plasmid replication initiation protein|nr:replication initiation protein [Bacteroidales bacterium]
MSKSEQSTQKGVTLAQANTLTQARYNFTVVEKRAVYLIIKEVRKQFVDRKDGQKNLFDNLVVRMNTEDLTKAELELKEVYKALISLRKKTLFIEDDERVLGVGYINYFEHKRREPFLEIEVSKKIMPFLVELAEQFTAYNLTVAISLKTKYSQRFYEYCSQFEHSDADPNHKNSGYFFSTVEDLRNKLMLGDKYPRYKLFKDYVLDVAQKELKTLYDANQCNLYFEYKEEKYGRTVDKLHFFVYSKDSKKSVPGVDNLLDQVYYIRLWLENWLSAKKRPKNKQWIDQVISHINLNADLIPKLYKRLAKLMKEEPTKNHAAIARHIIEEDFLP